MRISIALASFNGEKYLKEQLYSFLSQTKQPDELVISDDGSTDQTINIIHRFAEIAPFNVRFLINDSASGYASNFNNALVNTTGDLVFLSDQDDVWYPEKIERMSAIAEKDSYSFVFMNDAVLTDASLNTSGLTKLGQIKSAGFNTSSFVMGCCVAVKRELLDFCLPIPDAYPAHDSWIVSIAEGMGRKHIYPEVLQFYRRHGRNESEWIVNSNTRITRKHVFLHRIKSLYNQYFHGGYGLTSSTVAGNSPLELMSDWVKGAIERVEMPYSLDLLKYSLLLDKQMKLHLRRNDIRVLKFPARLIAVLNILLKGDYLYASGWKSAIRDLMALKS